VVTDPTHPLYGRRFQVLSISHPLQRLGQVIVAYRDCLRLRIPVQATNLNPDNLLQLRTKYTLVALCELLALTKECDGACIDHPATCGDGSPTV
jgi:hypothetical protein